MIMLLVAIYLAVVFGMALFCCYKQIQENRQVRAFNNEVGISTELSIENARKVVEYLRHKFNADKDSFKQLDQSSRSFLRDSAGELLQYREGLCGEGARVLVCCLHQLGFDACRMTLFTRWLHPSHTVVSVMINQQELLLDTLNSQQAFFDFLHNNDISSQDFLIMGYEKDVNKRRRIKQALKAAEETSEIKLQLRDKYICYSYDSMPFSKIAALFRWNQRILNFNRPGRLLGVLAEQPYSLRSIAWLLVGLVSLLLIKVFSEMNLYS